MSSNWIIAITVAAIIGVFAILYLVSSLERMRTNRSIKIGELQNRAHRIQHMLTSAPSNAVSNNVKKAGYLEIERCLQAILNLDNKNGSAKRRYAEIEQALQKLNNEPPATLKLGAIRDENQLKAIRKQLTDLFSFVQTAAKMRSLDGDTARRECDTLKRLFTESGATFYLTSAKTQAEQKKYRFALHQYKMAMNEYKKSNLNNMYSAQIKNIQETMATIEQQDSQKQNAHEKSEKTESSLASAMENIQREQDGQWQKRNSSTLKS